MEGAKDDICFPGQTEAAHRLYTEIPQERKRHHLQKGGGHYDFVSGDTLAYFQRRLDQAPRDADFALDYVKREARRPDQQEAVLDDLRFKCDVLWAQLDAIETRLRAA